MLIKRQLLPANRALALGLLVLSTFRLLARQAIVDATFAVVLATLAVSTLTVARAARLARKEAASS